MGATIAAFLPVILIVGIFGASFFFGDDEVILPHTTIPALPAPHHSTRDADEDDEPARLATAPSAAPVAPAPAPQSSLPTKLLLVIAGVFVFGLVGMTYLPMAKLANVVMGSPFTCFNYPFVAHSIVATMKSYAVCLAMYFGIAIVVGMGELVVALANIMVFTGVGLAFLELYGMTVLMRLLGLFYRMNQAKLGWMAD